MMLNDTEYGVMYEVPIQQCRVRFTVKEVELVMTCY